MIKKEDLIKTAQQARIKISSKEANELIPQVKEVLDYFALLSKADTKDTPETIHPLEIVNRFREDKGGESLSQEKALENSKNKRDGYFIGPTTK